MHSDLTLRSQKHRPYCDPGPHAPFINNPSFASGHFSIGSATTYISQGYFSTPCFPHHTHMHTPCTPILPPPAPPPPIHTFEITCMPLYNVFCVMYSKRMKRNQRQYLTSWNGAQNIEGIQTYHIGLYQIQKHTEAYRCKICHNSE